MTAEWRKIVYYHSFAFNSYDIYNFLIHIFMLLFCEEPYSFTLFAFNQTFSYFSKVALCSFFPESQKFTNLKFLGILAIILLMSIEITFFFDSKSILKIRFSIPYLLSLNFLLWDRHFTVYFVMKVFIPKITKPS